MLINEINNKWKEYFKEGNKDGKAALELVRVAYKNAEIEKRAKGQEMNDEDTIKVIQKVVKNLNEEYASISQIDSQAVTEKIIILTGQLNILEAYLPKQLTADEILNILRTSLNNKTMPEIMKFFKENYAGKVDMKMVSELVKKV